MKKFQWLFLPLIFLFACVSSAQTTFHTSGKYLLDECNDTVVLRGVDYAPYNWGYDATSEELDQIALTGANCVRMVWYANGSPATEYTNAHLDSILTHCRRRNMIPIIELQDMTCQNDTNALISLAGWYTGTAIASILQNHADDLIVDVANEALYHNWATNPASAATAYKRTYNAIVSNLRSSGFLFPIMIDAPDCGTDISVFSSLAGAINTSDPQHNMLFSAHAYWYAYANNDSTQMNTLINTADALNVPVLLGEFANTQDDTVMCEWNLNYTALLHNCQAKNFPWLCWGWDHDGCAFRQMSSNGNFNSLTAYGNDIVNNTQYGLLHTAHRAPYLLNNGCLSTGISSAEVAQTPLFTSRQIDDGLEIRSLSDRYQRLILSDITGRIVFQSGLLPQEVIDVKLLPGLYFIYNDRMKARKAIVW